MFIYSFRFKKFLITELLLILAALFSVTIIFQYNNHIRASSPEDNTMIFDFAEMYGWEIDKSSLVSENIVFFNKKNKAFDDYLLLQKSQGFDISPYFGKDAVRCTMRVLNFPGFEAADNIFISIFLSDGKIFAADIHSSSVDGFICGVVN